MTYEKRSLNIADLDLDPKNPRFDPANNQKEAIKLIFDDQKDKLCKLACDIVERGLNPSSRFIVFKENNRLVVGDGNRRLCALKVLKTPDLIENKKDQDKFRKLCEEFKLKKLATVDCIVFTKREDAKCWIENNHGGQQAGRGQINWGTREKQRFLETKSIGMLAQEKLLARGEISAEENSKINLTTLDRVLHSKVGRVRLSISIDQNKTIFGNTENLKKVVKALIGERVKEVYDNATIEKFLEKTLGSPRSTKSVIKNGKVAKNTGKAKRCSAKNDTVIFGENLSLQQSIVNDIYCDICEIYELHKQKNGGFLEILGFSLRLLVEVAANEYCKRLNVDRTKKEKPYNHFFKLIKEAADQKHKTSLTVDPDTRDFLSEEWNVQALLAKLAHGEIGVHLSMIMNLSKIIAPALKKYFAAEETGEIS